MPLIWTLAGGCSVQGQGRANWLFTHQYMKFVRRLPVTRSIGMVYIAAAR